jgi:hypothetical protein
MRLCLLAISLIALFLTTHSATVYLAKLGDPTKAAALFKDQSCIDVGLTLIYSLKVQNQHYWSSTSDNLNGTTCGQKMRSTTTGGTAPVIQNFQVVDNDCATKCGLNNCLCESDMSCTPPSSSTADNTCVEYYTCDSGSSKCVANPATVTKIRYKFPIVNDAVQRDTIRRQYRDAISQYGIDAHCWTEQYVYDSPSYQGSKGDYTISILNNKNTKKGCGYGEFTFPKEKYPKTTPSFNSNDISIEMQKDISNITMDCYDNITTKQLFCGSKCVSPCQSNALCVNNQDCLSDSCKQVEDVDGKKMDEKRCNFGMKHDVFVVFFILFVFLVVLF